MAEQPKVKVGEHGGKARIGGFRENPSILAITVVQVHIGKNLAHDWVKLERISFRWSHNGVIARESGIVKAQGS